MSTNRFFPEKRFTLVKTTLLDYPGKVAAAVFLPGCHLRCPYCHNPEFADPALLQKSAESDESPLNADRDSFAAFAARRASLLGGIAFSGGEALLHPLLPELIEIAKNHGLSVKIDTAGLLPDRLKDLIDSKKPDYAAMDFKTLPERYGELGWRGNGEKSAETLLRRSLEILASSGLKYEVRTTVVPGLVDKEVLKRIAGYLAGVPLWIWQPYVPGKTLDPQWSDLPAPREETLVEWASSIESDIPIRIR